MTSSSTGLNRRHRPTTSQWSATASTRLDRCGVDRRVGAERNRARTHSGDDHGLLRQGIRRGRQRELAIESDQRGESALSRSGFGTDYLSPPGPTQPLLDDHVRSAGTIVQVTSGRFLGLSNADIGAAGCVTTRHRPEEPSDARSDQRPSAVRAAADQLRHRATRVSLRERSSAAESVRWGTGCWRRARACSSASHGRGHVQHRRSKIHVRVVGPDDLNSDHDRPPSHRSAKCSCVP